MNREQLDALYANEFMKPVIYYGRFFECETEMGTEFIDQDLIGKTCNPTSKELEQFTEGFNPTFSQIIDGYGYYISAAGYMDRTELSVANTEQDAIDSLEALIG
jgi:hypothetical protein